MHGTLRHGTIIGTREASVPPCYKHPTKPPRLGQSSRETPATWSSCAPRSDGNWSSCARVTAMRSILMIRQCLRQHILSACELSHGRADPSQYLGKVCLKFKGYHMKPCPWDNQHPPTASSASVSERLNETVPVLRPRLHCRRDRSRLQTSPRAPLAADFHCSPPAAIPPSARF